MTLKEAAAILSNAREARAKNLPHWLTHARRLKQVGIIYTRWYPDVIAGLQESAEIFFRELEVPFEKIKRIEVSGSWELPLVTKNYIISTNPDFVIVLGCIVKGETPHFDYLCQTVTAEMMRLQMDTGTPIGFGILTVHSLEQAQARVGKGTEAAEAAFRAWTEVSPGVLSGQ